MKLESRVSNSEFTVHDAAIWHVESNERFDTEDLVIELDGVSSTGDAQVWNQLVVVFRHWLSM